jgi:hypothetical protein
VLNEPGQQPPHGSGLPGRFGPLQVWGRFGSTTQAPLGTVVVVLVLVVVVLDDVVVGTDEDEVVDGIDEVVLVVGVDDEVVDVVLVVVDDVGTPVVVVGQCG